MSHAVDAVDAAAIALNDRSWTPSHHELTLARDFFTRRDAIPQRLLPGMPQSPAPRAGSPSTSCGWKTSPTSPANC